MYVRISRNTRPVRDAKPPYSSFHKRLWARKVVNLWLVWLGPLFAVVKVR